MGCRINLLLIVLLVWGLQECRSQSVLRQKVSIKVNQVELHLVIEELQKQAGVLFFYSQNAIGAQRKVTCQYTKTPLKTLLDEMFPPLGIDYKLIDNKIVLFSISEKGRQERQITQNDSTAAGNPGEKVTPRKRDNLIKGRVLSNTGQPLSGASVVISRTQLGTVSNDSGYFFLETDLVSGELQVSYTAYRPIRMNFSVETALPEIRLVPLISEMGEVVVIGYGTQTRNTLTNATSTVKGSTLADAPVATIDAALQGRATGVMVSQQGGSPGAPVRIQVRGTSSISSGTEPLYIIDGVYVFQEITGVQDGITSNAVNPLSTLNPDDVASIEVLKDAAATAIYGARGANGVIFITTKQGRKDQGTLKVTLNRGTTRPIKLIDYVSGEQWLKLVDEARMNTVGFGISPGQEKFNPLVLVSNALPTPTGVSGPQFEPLNTFTRTLAEQTNTNWRDRMVQQGSFTDIKMSAGSATDKSNFYLSGSYWDESGILSNQRMQRVTIRSNLQFSPNVKWQFGAKIAPSLLINSFAQTGVGGNGASLGRINAGATGGWGQVNNGALPIMPVFNTDGTYFDPMRGRNTAAGSDPSNFSSKQQQQRVISNLFAEMRPFAGLTLRAEGGADFMNAQGLYWVSDQIRYNRYASETGAFIQNYSATFYGTYKTILGKYHNLIGTLGAEAQKSTYRRQVYTFEGLTGNQQEIGEVSNGNQTLAAVSGIFPDQAFTSLFARVNYDFKKRYLATFSIRRDGSSVFSPSNRIGYFPSFSAGWLISEEDWYRNSDFGRSLSFAKFRTSFGQTGNASIPSFAFLSNYVGWPVYGQAGGYSFSVLGNPEIRWEKNNQVDAALELGAFNNRIRTSFGWFTRTSQDMLLSVPVAPTVGIGAGNQTVIINIGNLRNSGFEWEVSTLICDNGKSRSRLRWNVDANFSWLEDKVLKLADNFSKLPSGEFPVANGIFQGTGITQIGGRLGAYYLAEYAGLDSEGFETIYEIDRDVLRQTGQTVRTGRVLRATASNVNNNRMVLGNKTGLPVWYGGVTQLLSWQGFELKMHITFQGGNYIYDGHEENVSYVRTGNNVLLQSLVGNTWSQQNRDAKYPKPTWNLRDNNLGPNGEPLPQNLGTRTTRFLYKGDYARLKTLSIAYNVPAAWVKRMKLRELRVNFSGQNLLTFTKYPGFDPEMVITGPGTQGRNLSQGFLNSAPVPQVKTLMAGITVGF